MVSLLSDESASLALKTPIPLTLHPAAVYLRSLNQGSRSTMRQSLNAIAHLLTHHHCDADTLDWSKLRYRHTIAIQAALLKRYEPNTARKMMSALRRVLAIARKLKVITAVDYEAAVDLPRIKVSKKLRGRALSQSEITTLIQVCQQDESAQGVRDAALIAILRGAGVRRAEVVKLSVTDFRANDGKLEIRAGKGGKDRTVYLPKAAIGLVKQWLTLRGNEAGALLCPIRKGGHIQIRTMTAQAVFLIVQKRAAEAGLAVFSPHDFRRTFCSDLLDAGVDIVTVQRLAGHASPTTTAKYDRRGEETKLKAVQNLGF